MKAKKLIRQSVAMTIAEYNRVTVILFPDAEPIHLTDEQNDKLSLAEIDSAMSELVEERDRILLEQSHREASEYTCYSESYSVDEYYSAVSKDKAKTKKL